MTKIDGHRRLRGEGRGTGTHLEEAEMIADTFSDQPLFASAVSLGSDLDDLPETTF
jgi:hypothetical protein